MLRIRRTENVQSLSHFRSAFTRGVYNDALPGVPNLCHTTSSRVDSSYLTEEGRCATYQHENRLIVAYSPKRAGHTGVSSFRTDFIFSYAAPFDAFTIDGKTIDAFPLEVTAGSRICIRDHRTLILLIPLNPSPSSGTKPVRVWVERDFLIISTFNYNGSAQNYTRDEINAWRSGYFLEVREVTDFGTWGDFLEHAQRIQIAENVDERGTREIVVRSDDCEMKMWYDPFKERILSRTWCGVEDRITHLTVSAAGTPGGPFLPQTLFGSEGRNQ